MLINVVVCFALGFTVAASIHWISPLKRGLDSVARQFQEAYLALYDASRPTLPGSSEYLVFLKGVYASYTLPAQVGDRYVFVFTEFPFSKSTE